MATKADRSKRQYGFTDRTHRVDRAYEDVSKYKYDLSLGRGVEVIILVKWDNQREHDENLRELSRVNGAGARQNANTLRPSPRERRRYFDGYVVRTGLGRDRIDASTATVQAAVQPTGVDIRADGLTAYACGNRILLFPSGNIRNSPIVIENRMFARLHSVEFSEDGRRLLTASSSLDLLFEVDVQTGSVTWAMDMWGETPYNRNVLGQAFFRKQTPETRGYLLNPSSSVLNHTEQLRDARCVVDDPAAYNGLGLGTTITPVFVNAVDYDGDDQILATSFARGEAWRINRRTRQVDVIASSMGRPHGLHRAGTSGYFVSDTLGERVVFINNELDRERVLDLSKLGGRKAGLEASRWLQYTTRLRPNLYCAVMTSRQKIMLFDPKRKVMRDIQLDPDWGVQMVVAGRAR
jgi:hypothetical protein